MFVSLRRYAIDRLSSEGGAWLLLVHALFFVPAVMAAFFYPRQVLVGAGLVLLAAAVAYRAYLSWHRRRLRAGASGAPRSGRRLI